MVSALAIAMARVFVSSTCTDLASFRDEARKAIAQKRMEPLLSEDWEAAGYPPLAECLERIDELDPQSDVVIAIVARWHGWTPRDQPDGVHKSITRLECERAAERGVTIIPLFLDDEVDWPAAQSEDHRLVVARERRKQDKTISLDAVEDEIERNKAALADFKEWLSDGRQFKSFGSKSDLNGKIVTALDHWQEPRGKPKPAPRVSNKTFDRGAYLKWLAERSDPMGLLGLDARQAQRARLRNVYIPALVRIPEAVRPARGRRRIQLDVEQSAGLLLHQIAERSLYVAGAPGAGKSTFCRWLTLITALGRVPEHPLPAPQDFTEVFPTALGDRLPVLCALRHLGRLRTPTSEGRDRLVCQGDGEWTCESLTAALCAWLDHDKPGGLDGVAFRAAIDRGECLLILDGVDELPTSVVEAGVEHRPRANLVSGLGDALHGWSAGGNRVLLTSRPYGLQARERHTLGLEATDLDPLPPVLQELFIRRWYQAVDPAEADDLSAALLRHLDERQDEGIAEMRQNPMLLTALCVKFHEGRRLPKDVYELYDKVIDQVLYGRYHETTDEQRIRRQLAAIALGMHTGEGVGAPRVTPAAAVTLTEVDKILTLQAKHESRAESADAATEKREALLTTSGLLLPRGDGEAEFYHLSFQELLAAERMHFLHADGATTLRRHLEERAATAEWRRTLTFLFAADARQRAERALETYLDVLGPHLRPLAVLANPNPALLLADCLEIAHAKAWKVEDLADDLLDACRAALDPRIDPRARARLWEVAGRLGFDRRRGVGLDANGLPDIEWCDVPEGEVELEKKAGTFRVAPFRIAKYPITHAQFEAFTAAGDGYRSDAWWEPAALERSDGSRSWSPRWTAPNGPCECIDWWEAMAFCRWLTAKLEAGGLLAPGMVIRLPAEWEWQQAATASKSEWTYPWGPDFAAQHADTAEGGLDRTSPVGLHPSGASPVGAMDMAGNVWEWCLNAYEPAGDVDPGGEVPRVVRGGSWLFGRDLARAACRSGDHPDGRSDGLGFRVCLSSPISSKHGARRR